MNNIEAEFFDTFEIKPIYELCSSLTECTNKVQYNCLNCNKKEVIYPEITSDVLLEIICIISWYNTFTIFQGHISAIKEIILQKTISYFHLCSVKKQKYIKDEIQKLLYRQRGRLK